MSGTKRITTLSALACFGVLAATPLLADPNGAAPVPEVTVEPVTVPLSRDAEELRDAILQTRDRALLEAAYAARSFEPVWTPGRVAALVAALRAAPAHGLPAARYDAEGIEAVFADPGVDPAARELVAARAFLAYADDISAGLLKNPRKVHRDIWTEPQRRDPGRLLDGLADADDPAAYLASLAPAHPHYQTLLAEKTRLEALIAAGGWGEPVPKGRSLKLGKTGPRVVALRARLGAITGADLGDSEEFDAALEEAVKAFQLDLGLNDDGVVGPKTLGGINATAEDRLKQVLVNLERQRWLNIDRGKRYIYVNQADFSVQIIDGGEVALWTRAVVGQRAHPTQEFTEMMTHMVVNPTWYVPRSIATEEMLPRLKANPNALGPTMRIVAPNGQAVNPALIDFTQFTKRSFPFSVRQTPGAANALGKVKFMLPNRFNIYLHDTPAKNLFGKDVRAYSHGCVRLQKPFEFAYTLLGWQSDDPKGVFQKALRGGRERRIDLKEPVPVYLTYQSAWVNAEGAPQYRADIYGRDKAVFRALEAEGVQLRPVEG